MGESRWSRRAVLRIGGGTVLGSLAGCLDTLRGNDAESDSAGTESTDSGSDRESPDIAESVPWEHEFGMPVDSLHSDPSGTAILGTAELTPFAIDADGSRRWMLDTSGRVSAADEQFAYLDWIRHPEAEFAAVDSGTGAVKWRFVPPSEYELATDLALGDDRLYLLTQQGGGAESEADRSFARLYAVRPRTGEELWRKHLGARSVAAWRVASAEGNAFAFKRRGDLRMFSPDGQELWSDSLAQPESSGYGDRVRLVFSDVFVRDGTLYVGVRWNDRQNTASVRAITLQDGRLQWESEGYDIVTAVDDDAVLCSYMGHRSAALDSRDGSEVWQHVYEDNEPAVWGPVVNEIQYVSAHEVGFDSNSIRLLAQDVATGEILANREFSGNRMTGAVVIDDWVFFGTGWELPAEADHEREYSGTVHGITGFHAEGGW